MNKGLKAEGIGGEREGDFTDNFRVWLTQHTSMIEKHTFSYHGLLSPWIHGLKRPH
jgi:hypothetical protein